MKIHSISVFFISAGFFLISCSSSPVQEELCETPLVEQLFNDPTGEIDQYACQEYEMTETEQKLMAVYWSLAVVSYMQDEFDPWLLDPDMAASLEELARKYPSFFEPCELDSVELLMVSSFPLEESVRCTEPCKIRLSDFPESLKTFGGEAAGLLNLDDYWSALEAAMEIKNFFGSKGDDAGPKKSLKEKIRDAIVPKDKVDTALSITATGLFIGAGFVSGGATIALLGLGALVKFFRFNRKLQREILEAAARIEECKASQITECGKAVPTKGGDYWRCMEHNGKSQILPIEYFCNGDPGDCPGGDDEDPTGCEYWCSKLHPELYQCNPAVCLKAKSCDKKPECPGGEDESPERCEENYDAGIGDGGELDAGIGDGGELDAGVGEDVPVDAGNDGCSSACATGEMCVSSRFCIPSIFDDSCECEGTLYACLAATQCANVGQSCMSGPCCQGNTCINSTCKAGNGGCP